MRPAPTRPHTGVVSPGPVTGSGARPGGHPRPRSRAPAPGRRLRRRALAVVAAVLLATCAGGASTPAPTVAQPVGLSRGPVGPVGPAIIATLPRGDTLTLVGGSRVLPPYCSGPGRASVLPAPYSSPSGCPATRPVGEQVGVLLGLSLLRLVHLTIPAPGWTAAPTPGGSGFELTGPDGGAIVVIPYPRLVGGADLQPGPTLPVLLAQRGVRVVDTDPWSSAGWEVGPRPNGKRGLTMALTPAPGALLSTDCRSAAPCLPLLTGALESSASPGGAAPGRRVPADHRGWPPRAAPGRGLPRRW